MNVEQINKDDLLVCECGSVFFQEFRARTYDYSKFIYQYSKIRDLEVSDMTIPVAKCIFCGTIHIPRTSFAGWNTLDKPVQIYATLLKQLESFAAKKELAKASIIKLAREKAEEDYIVEEAIKNVETEPDSSAMPKDDVQPSKKGSTSRKNNKKVVA